MSEFKKVLRSIVSQLTAGVVLTLGGGHLL